MKTFATALYGPPAGRTPRFIQVLFWDSRASWLWLVARLYLGWQWFEAGREKLDAPASIEGGSALNGFWQRAVAVPATGRPPITYGWYRDFLQYLLDHEWYTWFAKLIAIGEMTLGVLLILGAFVGVAAIGGAFMNFNFMLAVPASTNPLLSALAVLLLLAWRIAGNMGLDRFLLPLLSIPWGRGRGGPTCGEHDGAAARGLRWR